MAALVMVVIPTYNEAENLPVLVGRLLALPVPGLQALVVDDASPDGTGQVAEALGRRYPGRVHVLHRQGKAGLGEAYKAGFRWALQREAAFVVEMDADLSHPPEVLSVMLQRAQRCDVVVGSRYVLGGSLDPRWGLARRLVSRMGNLYARLVTGLYPRDVTSGFKCFRREVLAEIDLGRVRSRGFAFQVEMAYACQRRGYRVEEVPIRFLERRRGSSKISWAILWEALWRLPLLRWTWP